MTLPHPERAHDAFALEQPLEIFGREPIPDELAQAKRQFAQAKEAYAAKQYTDAAREFIAAAQVLLLGHSHAYVAEFARFRVIAYHNAGWSALMTGEAGLARELLQAAATSDPDCADEINSFLESLQTTST